MRAFITLSEEDNVAVAIRDVAAGSETEVNGAALTVRDDIPLGHKVALGPIKAGERVRKFGVPIGRASEAIPAGAHVHMHNIRSDYLNNAIEHHE